MATSPDGKFLRTLTKSNREIRSSRAEQVARKLYRTYKRDIEDLEDKIETMTAQGRMQAWVLGSLPLGMAFLIYKVDPTMVSPLWEDPIGWIILFFIALFEIVGIFMIRKIVSVDV